MSVQALSCAFAVRGLTPSEKLVLLALANYADDKMRCWPSQETLAETTELSERTVWGALRSLESRRVLSRVLRRRSDGTRTTAIFTLHVVGEVGSIPLDQPADFAKTTRKSCESNSQRLPNQLAAVATLTTFEPSEEEPSEEEPNGARVVALRPSAWFEEFWLAYPSKVGKKVARPAYDRAIRTISGPDPPQVILAGLDRAKQGRRWREGYIPNPATWLNQARWEDEIEPHGRQPQSSSKLDAKQANLARSLAGLESAIAARDRG